MTLTHIHRTHYIYEVDNIPDHRSRRFGCCPCLLAVRTSDSFASKKAVTDAATSITASAKSIYHSVNSFCSSTPHCCRHTFATLIKPINAPDKDKLELMGHTSTEMLQHYQHVNLDDLRRITDNL